MRQTIHKINLAIYTVFICFFVNNVTFATVENVPIENAPFAASSHDNPNSQNSSPNTTPNNPNSLDQNYTNSPNNQNQPQYSVQNDSQNSHNSFVKNGSSSQNSNQNFEQNKQGSSYQNAQSSTQNIGNSYNSSSNSAAQSQANSTQNYASPSTTQPANNTAAYTEAQDNTIEAPPVQNAQKSPQKKITAGATDPKPFAIDLASEVEQVELPVEKAAAQKEEPLESGAGADLHKVPEDLPEVDESEIVLPQMPASKAKKSNNLAHGLMAWGLIAAGIAIILFVLYKGTKQSKDLTLNRISSKRKKKKTSKLLPDKYYKD